MPLADARAYDRLAREIAGGDWIGSHVFYQDPLYSYLLAILYKVFGASPAPVVVVQSLLGGLAILCIGLLARRLFGFAPALVAATIAALYGPFLFGEMLLDKNALTVVLTAAMLLALVRADETGHERPLVGTGVLLGLLALVRGNFLLVAPLAAIALAWRRPAERWRRAGLVLAGTLLPILPVTARNAIVGHDFVLTTSQAGQNFAIGNNPDNHTGGYEPPSFVRANPDYEEADFRAAAEAETGRELKPSEVSSFWTRKTLAWIAGNPGRALELAGRKALLLLNGAEVTDVYCTHLFEDRSWILRLPLLGFAFVLPLAAIGLVRAAPGSRDRALVAFVAAGYALSVLPFFVFDRYRLPLVVPLIPFAGFGVVAFVADARARSVRWIAGDVMAAVAALAIALLPIVHHSLANDRFNVGTTFLLLGDRTRAIEEFRVALALEPDLLAARHNLGEALLADSRPADALEQFQTEARALPIAGEPIYGIARAKRALGQLDDAITEFVHALDRNPNLHAARFDLARTYEALGHDGNARSAYEAYLREAPAGDSKKRAEAEAALRRLSAAGK
ncbi:MAG: glycosyltransferase family 39 protein [Planctomycetes bacterium]|nr:glycosyltransferase family 39 protein [Planctomycetota bacterium]